MGSPPGWEPKGWPRDKQPGQPGHPGWALLVAVVTVVFVVVAGLVAWMFIDSGFFVFQASPVALPPGPRAAHVAALALGLAVLTVGGLWLAWRVGSGRWSPRRRSTPEAATGEGDPDG